MQMQYKQSCNMIYIVQDLLNATKNIGDLGFVLTFIFRTWLSNKKFSYNGWGMTEEKEVLRRKVIANSFLPEWTYFLKNMLINSNGYSYVIKFLLSLLLLQLYQFLKRSIC
ncbi:BnaC02g43400D [Brassica napus]|uniref:BnaC02g43400D protein n=2 Tax=Brassica TaxID=3705 RepID=A0A078H8V7_BRANA|nr:BnaC02g43400D [Brassica napus]VDD27449.1 unnamed protein product [Brassica oleracea]